MAASTYVGPRLTVGNVRVREGLTHVEAGEWYHGDRAGVEGYGCGALYVALPALDQRAFGVKNEAQALV